MEGKTERIRPQKRRDQARPVWSRSRKQKGTEQSKGKEKNVWFKVTDK